MPPQEFDREMTGLLNDWCDRRAIAPLRKVLPHYPMPNGFTDELTELACALKTVRVQLGATLSSQELDRLIVLLQATEDALAKSQRSV
jgi:hypothetical protein